MRALVTGGGGFLGSALVRRLIERGDKVRVLARGEYPELQQLGAELMRGDVRDAEARLRLRGSVRLILPIQSATELEAWLRKYRAGEVESDAEEE